jgi:hypothetical protein
MSKILALDGSLYADGSLCADGSSYADGSSKTSKPAAAKASTDQSGKNESGSIRVDIDKIDTMINMVGELVITRSLLGQIGSDFSPDKLTKPQERLRDLERNGQVLHASDKRIRVWCAAASTGEEPYSIAIVFRENFPAASGWDVKILATDIDSDVVNTAIEGVYTDSRFDGVPACRLKRWFTKTTDGYSVDQDLKDILTFKTLNLLREWPVHGPFDVVFCRNVIIYFDKQTQRMLFEKIQKLMPSGRFLFIGHSESLLHVSTEFESKGGTVCHKR